MVFRQINQLTAELQQMSVNCADPIDSEERTAFLGTNRGRVREIGEELHRLGGYKAMLAAYKQISPHDQLELSHAWDMVGEWTI